VKTIQPLSPFLRFYGKQYRFIGRYSEEHKPEKWNLQIGPGYPRHFWNINLPKRYNLNQRIGYGPVLFQCKRLNISASIGQDAHPIHLLQAPNV
jgi:hypothetical protein